MHLPAWSQRWSPAALLLPVAVAEWSGRPGWGWAAAALVVTGAALIRPRAERPAARWLVRGALLAVAATVVVGTWRLERVRHAWPTEREALVARASARLGSALRGAGARAGRLAASAVAVCDTSRVAAFAALERDAAIAPPGYGVVVLQEDGTPWAWAGWHAQVPAAVADSLSVEGSARHLVLEERRACAHRRTVVAGVLIWASADDPGGAWALSARFQRATDVALRVWPGAGAPDSPDVFDYQVDAPDGARTLFSVETTPPAQGERFAQLRGRVRDAAGWLLLLLLVTLAWAAPAGAPRAAVLVAGAWAAVRGPLGAVGGGESLWSQATFFRDFLGPVSASAGALLASGAVAMVLAAMHWGRPRARRWWGVALAGVLALGAPYLISSLARGITPPADGVPMGLWLAWQFALVTASGACIALAAALTRGVTPAARVPLTWWVGIAAAVGAAWLGLWVWSPRGGWPDWYPLPWAGALALFLWRPAPRWATIVGVGLVAGTAAALVTWGAELDGRLEEARRDVQRLGDAVDPLAVPRLERLVAAADSAPPAGAADLYSLWRATAPGEDDYPAVLSLWGGDGRLRAELALDSVDAPAPLVAALVRGLPPSRATEITALSRIPGVHLALTHRLPDGGLLSAVAGPRTALIPAASLSWLLESPARGAPLYELTLTYPEPGVAADLRPLRWQRQGWDVTGERQLALPGGVRHVHARVDLGTPARLLVRGALVLAADVAALAVLWGIAALVAGTAATRPGWRRLVRAYRFRLAVALAGFFVVPAVGFAAWTFVRAREDAARRRDLLLEQTLRAAQPAAALLSPGDASEGLRDLARSVGAEFGFYEGGRLRAASHPVLAELGVLPALLPASAYSALALEDQLEEVGDVPGAAHRSLRVGYRVVRPGPPGAVGVLASPRLSDDGALAREQQDLALAVLLAALVGALAALGAAQLAARAFARPVSDLRAAALAIGRGEPALLEPPAEVPTEFEPVFAGFARMAADVAAGRAALEEARRRTAGVLATVATGVVAVDGDGRILLANERARAWLGAALPEGHPLDGQLGAAWAPVARAVARALAGERVPPVEFDVGDRRFGAEVAGLGDAPGGVVVAVTDLTDAARAARVLAWGEMARQVAHEIKNPLTPVRLGLQHLARVHRERPQEFDRVFHETGARIFAEIDRLDTVARAFSRFAAPAGAAPPLDRVVLQPVVEEVLALYRLGGGEGPEVRIEAAPAGPVGARRDEVKEVLVNLVENARNAGARVITVSVGPGTLAVADDGPGIPAERLPHLFEPRFSTSTSGAGLGLSIVKRLVEGWGAEVGVTSRAGAGTEVRVRWPELTARGG